MRYLRSMGLFKFADNLNMKHEIATIHIFHYVVQAILRKEKKHTMQKSIFKKSLKTKSLINDEQILGDKYAPKSVIWKC